MRDALVSVILPAYGAEDAARECARRLDGFLGDSPHEILVCHERGRRLEGEPSPTIRWIENDLGPGLASARGDVVVIAPPPLPDDLQALPAMVQKVRHEAFPLVLGRDPRRRRSVGGILGRSLAYLMGVPGFWDSTNLCACSASFLDLVPANACRGPRAGLALAIEARRMGLRTAEVPVRGPDSRRAWASFRTLLRRYPQAVAEPLLVWTAFAILLFGAGRLATLHSLPAPFWEEWSLVSRATGHAPVSLEWLWAREDGDRLLLPKLLYLLAARASGLDARCLNLLSALMLGSMAFLGILAVRRARGRTELVDAFFPLLLLHGNHWVSLTSPFQITLVLPSLLICVLLCLALTGSLHRPGRATLGIGACLVCLALCGTRALPVAGLVSPWLFWVGYRGWRCAQGDARLGGAVAMMLATITCGLVLLRLPDLVRSGPGGPEVALPTVLTETSRVLVTGWGHAAADLWPFTGLAAIALVGLTVTGLLRSALHGGGPVLLLALAGLGCGALLSGQDWATLGRTGEAGHRILAFTCLIPLAAYLGSEIYPWRSVGRVQRVFLFGLVGVLLIPNSQEGAGLASKRRQMGEALLRDVREGMSIAELAVHHGRGWHPSPGGFATGMRMLRDSGMGVFRGPVDTVLSRSRPGLWTASILDQGTPDSGDVISLDKGRQALFAHAPTSLSFPLPPGTGKVRFSFGILEGASQGDGKTDGVEFRLALGDQGNRGAALWDRYLDPLHQASDRGLQTAEVEIPVAGSRPGNLFFETAPGPRGDREWDWSYWSDVEFITP